MRKIMFLITMILVALVASSAVFAGPGGQPPIKVGPIAIVGAEDIGTCNNVWALDSFNKFYTLTVNHDGTYNLQVNYKDGTFVTTDGLNPYGGIAYASPGACISGTYNGSTVAAGVTGRTHQEYNATVTATGSPNRKPNCGANNGGCTGSGDFLNAVFGAGNWTRTDWSWTGHYEAGSNGVWFDTSVNWPYNDRGDITGSPR